MESLKSLIDDANSMMTIETLTQLQPYWQKQYIKIHSLNGEEYLTCSGIVSKGYNVKVVRMLPSKIVCPTFVLNTENSVGLTLSLCILNRCNTVNEYVSSGSVGFIDLAIAFCLDHEAFQKEILGRVDSRPQDDQTLAAVTKALCTYRCNQSDRIEVLRMIMNFVNRTPGYPKTIEVVYLALDKFLNPSIYPKFALDWYNREVTFIDVAKLANISRDLWETTASVKVKEGKAWIEANAQRIRFISHRWVKENPDPGKLIEELLKKMAKSGKREFDYVWVDFLCTVQHFDAREIAATLIMLRRCNVDLKPIYIANYNLDDSAWCIIETMC